MTRRILIANLIAFVAPSLSMPQAQTRQVSVSGFISDTLSGASGASDTHIAASKRNVAAGMAKYAVYDDNTSQLYILEPQATAAAYLDMGKPIVVTGTLAPSPMKRAGQMVDPRTGEVKDFHRPVNSATPIAGVLTISSISIATPPK
jgi:hypothetical protein